MSGCAWGATDGHKKWNYIEAPVPRTDLSFAIFVHEIGHHVIGFSRFRLRCLEEFHVWNWAIDQMKLVGIEPTFRVTHRMNRSLEYAVHKALARGLKEVPQELLSYRGGDCGQFSY
ncbi:hypothetical protein KW783_04280 [Candidatus Parcubacteria bacterium]|nr:hypothetical protein [Candidatus Parcubacteria bacterium]